MNNTENLALVQKISAEFQAAWAPVSNDHKYSPTLLLVGGYQGSGKTTILNKVAPELGLTLISLDRIRQTLFDQGVQYSNEFTRTVNAIGEMLLRQAIQDNRSVGIDSNARPEKIVIYTDILRKSGGDHYRVYKVYLDTPIEELERRILSRHITTGVYQGTIAELRSTIAQYGEIDKSTYDLVIDTYVTNHASAAQLIESALQQSSSH